MFCHDSESLARGLSMRVHCIRCCFYSTVSIKRWHCGRELHLSLSHWTFLEWRSFRLIISAHRTCFQNGRHFFLPLWLYIFITWTLTVVLLSTSISTCIDYLIGIQWRLTSPLNTLHFVCFNWGQRVISFYGGHFFSQIWINWTGFQLITYPNLETPPNKLSPIRINMPNWCFYPLTTSNSDRNKQHGNNGNRKAHPGGLCQHFPKQHAWKNGAKDYYSQYYNSLICFVNTSGKYLIQNGLRRPVR